MVGDAYHAVALLRLADSRLELIARSLLPLHPHSIQALDQEHVIGASVSNFWLHGIQFHSYSPTRSTMTFSASLCNAQSYRQK